MNWMILLLTMISILGEEGSIYKKLIGHAGPVYSVSFSHDNQYLISCSEDKTGKEHGFILITIPILSVYIYYK